MAGTAGSGQDGAWPLVGRERELELIETACHGAVGAVLLGGPGAGKTRLARDAIDRLVGRRRDLAVMATATRSAAAVPLGALAQLVEPTAGETGDRLGAFASVMARFTGRTGPRPVLVVDDVHLLDSASAAMVHQLAVGGHAFVLLTMRTGEPAPDAVTALWMHDTAVSIEVPPLTDDDIERLTVAELDGPLDAVALRRLCRLCEGRPLLLREVLRAGRDSGALRRVDGRWRWTRRRYITDRLADVVWNVARGGGPDSLEPELLSLAEVLACGGPLALSLAQSMTDTSVIITAERCGLTAVERNGARFVVRLARPLLAEVIRTNMPLTRQREIWAALAHAMAETPLRRHDDLANLTRWRHQVGLKIPAESLLSTAEWARNRLDLSLAGDLARQAERAGAGSAAALLQAELHLEAGRPEHAAVVLPRLPGKLEPAQRLRWTMAYRRLQDVQAARRGNGCEPLDLPSPAGSADDRIADPVFLLYDGDNINALRADHDDVTGVWAATLAAGLLGRHDEAMTAAGRARRCREAGGSAWERVQIVGSGCLSLIAAGRLVNARELAERGYAEAADQAAVLGPDAMRLVAVCALLRGMVARCQGRVESALAHLTEAAVLLAELPTFPLQGLHHAELAAAHALAGDLDSAAYWIGCADKADDRLVPVCTPWIERARAWVSAAAGDLGQAAGHALSAAKAARRAQQPTVEAYALFDAVRFGNSDQAAARLAALARTIRLPVVAAMASIASALTTSDGDHGLDKAARILSADGHHLYAAEAAVAAHRHYTRTGRRSRAQASLVLATALKDQCEGARTPLLTTNDPHSPLTPREREVATLAAAGRSGPEIAAELGLSTRTVNNYLGRIYTKFGISGRGQLRSIFAD